MDPEMTSFQPTPSHPGQTQTIIIKYEKSKSSKRKEHFKATIAKTIGILLLVCGALLIMLQAVGVYVQVEKQKLDFYYTGQGQFSFMAIWSSPLVFLAGAFAIASARTKRTGFIVTTLVFSVLTAVFTAFVIGISAWVVADESKDKSHLYDYYGLRYTLTPEIQHLRKSSQAIAALMLILGLTDFISSIVLSMLCCAAVCCCKKPRGDTTAEGGEVVYLNPAASPPIIAPSSTSTFVPSNYQPEGHAGGASGCDLPPSYSTSEIHKVGLPDGDTGDCPTKVPL